MTSRSLIFWPPYPSALSFHFATYLAEILSFSSWLKCSSRATHDNMRSLCVYLSSRKSTHQGRLSHYDFMTTSLKQAQQCQTTLQSPTLDSGYSKPRPAFSNAQLPYLPTMSQQMPLFHVSQGIDAAR